MSVTYGFFNSVDGDRKYDALQMSSIFDGVINDGVFMTVGNRFAVTTANSLMNINVDTGRAWFNHTWTLNDTLLPLTVSASESLLDRIDAVILEVNTDTSVRANSIKIIKGEPDSRPVPPVMTRNDLISQYPLAYITVPAGALTIKSSNIQNLVGTSECPFVTGPLETVDVDVLYKQWEEKFIEWFDTVKSVLDGDTAGHLLNLIDEKAPIDHSSSESAYGVGNQNQYGHLMLSSVYTGEGSDSGVLGGKAATPFAVNKAYELASRASATANAAMPKAGGEFGGITRITDGVLSSGSNIRNIYVMDSSGNNVSTSYIRMRRV